MLSFKDTRDFLLLSYDMKLITDDEFGLLFDTVVSQTAFTGHLVFAPGTLGQCKARQLRFCEIMTIVYNSLP